MSEGEDERGTLKLKLVRAFSANVPPNKALGMRILEITWNAETIALPKTIEGRRSRPRTRSFW